MSLQNKRLSDTLKKSQLWSGVWSITLVEGQDLPEAGPGDVFARFRLGEQKYKSKVQQRKRLIVSLLCLLDCLLDGRGRIRECCDLLY